MKIYIRPITEQDGEKIVQWRNSEKVKNHCMTKSPITLESNLKFYRENVLTGKYKQFIVERIDEEFSLVTYAIATVYLKDIDYENKHCELCIFTSDDAEWYEESQCIAIKLLIDKAFNEYGMHKIYSYVFAKYDDEMQLLKNAGFTEETILKEESLGDSGYFEDIVRFCLFNNK